MKTYKATIGIEVHAELKTKSKMFCSCKNDPHSGEPNTYICPVCLAHPGTLPAVNKDAVEKILLVGNAIKGEIATYSEFDRKNYFYPDIPKAYQLSQYAFPFVKGGELDGVAITRVHLEEDTARSQHEEDGSVVDFNRAGVPLMELVTEPVIHDAKTAGHFAKELQLLLRTLGVSDANMEKGEMRVEANISISDTDELGTKVEVKNLNSFKAVEMAIEYEIDRQKTAKNKGEIIIQETRGWNEAKNKTFSQRTKETAEDYRYFPDPDIPKYDLQKVPEFSSSRLAEISPKLPLEIRAEYLGYGVKGEQIEVILGNKDLFTFTKAVVANLSQNNKEIQIAINYITSDLIGLLQETPDKQISTDNVPMFVLLIHMVTKGDVNSRVAKDLLPEVVFEGLDPEKVAKERGLMQSSNTEELMPIIDTIIAENPSVVAEFKAGKEASIQYLIGQSMKATKGSANPAVLKELLESKLKE